MLIEVTIKYALMYAQLGLPICFLIIVLHAFNRTCNKLNLPRLKSRGSQPRILTDSDTLGYPRSSYGSYICYAPTTRSPSFRIFIAAFTSLSCTAPHCGQTHSRTDKSLVPEFICPQQLQVWLDGKNLSILITFLPYHSAL